MIKNVIMPGNIDVNDHFWNIFGNCETEIAARQLVKLFQKQNPGAWKPIPVSTVDFCLSGLLPSYVLVADGMLWVTDEFIRRLSKYATIENFDVRSKNPIKRLGRRLWKMADSL